MRSLVYLTLIFIIPYLILKLINLFLGNPEQKIKKIINENLFSFKKDSDKIKVMLNDYELLSNFTYEEVQVPVSKTRKFFEFFFNSLITTKKIKIEKHNVIFKVIYKDKSIKIVSNTIIMDKTHIKYAFYKKGYTYAYIDKNNVNNYIIDLDFLNESNVN